MSGWVNEWVNSRLVHGAWLQAMEENYVFLVVFLLYIMVFAIYTTRVEPKHKPAPKLYFH